MSDRYRAWAIDLRLKDHPSPCWMGILNVTRGAETRPGLDGCRTALFHTRREARFYLATQQAVEGVRADGIYYWRDAVVRPVDVTIRARGGPLSGKE